jgi:hypothetical protein
MTVYTTKQMLNAMVERPAPSSFIRDKLMAGPAIVTDKKIIEIDKYTRKQGIAVYNSRIGGPTIVQKKSFTTDTHVSPYVFESVPLTASDVDERLPGETVYGSSAQRTAQTSQMESLEELNQRLDRLEEKQYVEAITSGTVTVANSSLGISYTVDYGMDSDNKLTLTGNDIWGGSTSDIIGNVETAGQRLAKKGYIATDIILDVSAAAKFRADTAILALLDNRRVQMGEINFGTLGAQRVQYIGMLSAVGVNVDIWCYLGGYETADDTFAYYLDTNRAIVLGAGVEIQQVYGKIENFKANFRAARYPQIVEDKYGKLRETTMESAPLAVLRNPNAIYSIKTGA